MIEGQRRRIRDVLNVRYTLDLILLVCIEVDAFLIVGARVRVNAFHASYGTVLRGVLIK